MRNPPDHSEKIGRHYFWAEGDMAVVVVDGDISEEHIVAMQRISRQLIDKYGYSLSLVDATRSRTITPEARRTSTTYQRESPHLGAVGVFGTGVMLRAINALYSRAAALLGSKLRQMAIFKTEAEAREWLEHQRVLLQSQVKRPSSS